MPVAEETVEDRLTALQGEIGDLVRPFALEVAKAAEAGAVDSSFTDRYRETARRLAALNDDLREDDFGPQALAELRGIIIDAMREAQEVDHERPLDAIDSLLVRAEQLRHIVRDAIDGHVDGVGGSAAGAMTGLRELLPTVKLAELAALLGRSQRQVQRWAAHEGPPPRRLELVARLAALLRHSWTERGVVNWFLRPRADLGRKKPIDLLDDPAREEDLLMAARRGRAQHGS
jgi:transcriptional regulator with XRE-family HTH domain